MQLLHLVYDRSSALPIKLPQGRRCGGHLHRQRTLSGRHYLQPESLQVCFLPALPHLVLGLLVVRYYFDRLHAVCPDYGHVLIKYSCRSGLASCPTHCRFSFYKQ